MVPSRLGVIVPVRAVARLGGDAAESPYYLISFYIESVVITCRGCFQICGMVLPLSRIHFTCQLKHFA